MKTHHSGETFTIYCVHEWFKSNLDASWGKIVAGLRRIDRNVLAKELATRHHVETPPSVGASHPISPPVSAQDSDGTQSSVTSGSDPVQPLTSEVSSDHPVKVTSESAPSNPVTSEVSSPHPVTGSTDPIQQVKEKIEHFQDTFADLMTDTQLELSDKESQDRTFFTKFRGYLMFLPASKKAIHVKFFRESENDFMEAKNILNLFVILNRYCDYSNYEYYPIIRSSVSHTPKRMIDYCSSHMSLKWTQLLMSMW